MSTDTGAKLPIFPFPLTMIYELADNIDALRIPIETLNREMFKNGFEVVEKWKYKCNNCSKEFQYAPTADNPDEQPFEANGDNYNQCTPTQKEGSYSTKGRRHWYVIHVEAMTWLDLYQSTEKTLENIDDGTCKQQPANFGRRMHDSWNVTLR